MTHTHTHTHAYPCTFIFVRIFRTHSPAPYLNPITTNSHTLPKTQFVPQPQKHALTRRQSFECAMTTQNGPMQNVFICQKNVDFGVQYEASTRHTPCIQPLTQMLQMNLNDFKMNCII